jgi:hypothetical protein
MASEAMSSAAIFDDAEEFLAGQPSSVQWPRVPTVRGAVERVHALWVKHAPKFLQLGKPCGKASEQALDATILRQLGNEGDLLNVQAWPAGDMVGFTACYIELR